MKWKWLQDLLDKILADGVYDVLFQLEREGKAGAAVESTSPVCLVPFVFTRYILSWLNWPI